jgi:hypothetical protein
MRRKIATLNIRTDEKTRAAITKLAGIEGRSVASMIERLIRAEYERKFPQIVDEDDPRANHGHARRYLEPAQ